MPDAFAHLLQQASQARRELRLVDAELDLTEAVALARRSGTPSDLAQALTRLGQIERDLHRLDASLGHYQEAVTIYRAEGNRLKLAHTIRHLGDIQQDAGCLALAEPFYLEALQLYRGHEQTPPLDLANAIRGLALLRGVSGKTESAALLWQEAHDIYQAVGVNEGVTECSRQLARLRNSRAGSD